MITSLLKSRTIWYAILLAALSVVQGFVLMLPITPVGQMLVGIVVAAGIVVLHAVTTQPLSEK